MKKVNFKRMTNQLLFGLLAVALIGGLLLNSQEIGAQVGPEPETIDETPRGDDSCDTCQRERRTKTVACIRTWMSTGGSGVIWMGDRKKCKSDENSNCIEETSCAQ
ncbi:MAG: hypothetical protein ACQESK_03555 [Bacteroidota bacterium]